MAQKCNLCSLDFKHDDQLKQHLEGKKHKKLESIKQERERSAQCSVFVSNLKKDMFQKHFEEHFSQFGKIAKVVIDQEKNSYAIIEYETEDSVEKCLAFQATHHKVNDKHVKVTRRQVKEFISKLPTGNDKKKEALDKLKEEALNVNKILGKCENFNEQVDKLIEYLHIDEEHMNERRTICESINRILKNYWSEKDYKVSIFGSSATGLACNGSDMDMTILFSDYFPENTHKQVKQPQITKLKPQSSTEPDSSSNNSMNVELDECVDLDDEPDVEEIKNNGKNNNNDMDQSLKQVLQTFFTEKKHDSFRQFELEHQIKLMARIFQRFLLEAKSLKTITNARCPVVRFMANTSKIYCDVSLNNYLAYENTKLIQLYIDLEPNLKKMIYLIRYWMKHKNLKFNSYSIIWLIIFYMQKSNIGYLPTVSNLSKMTNQVNEIHGWNCAFETDLKKIISFKPAITEPVNINNLLKGFFEFYSTFEYAPNKILVTNNATILTNDNNLDLHQLSKLAELNIQDPFDLSHNISAQINKSTLEHFVTECKASNELLKYSKSPQKSQTSTSNKGWGLILLMTKKALPLPTATSHQHVLTLKETVEKSMFKLKLVDESKNTEASAANIDRNNNQDLTVRKAIDFVLFLFKHCLLFEQLSNEQLLEHKRKRFKVLNQICDRVDLLGLNCSPKRLKVANNTSEDPNKPTNTYVCVIDENMMNNNNTATIKSESNMTKSIDDDDGNFVSSYLFNANARTWQGRRDLKRKLKQNYANKTDIEIENMVSSQLLAAGTTTTASRNVMNNIGFRIKFSIDSSVVTDTTCTNKYVDLQIRFDPLDETENQTDLINFMTLAHFLDVYINNCHEKFYNDWNHHHHHENNSNLIN